MSFNIALTGLNAATQDLGVLANNVANSATTGFKSSRAEFGDVFSTGNFATARGVVGLGTQLVAITQQFQQGNLTPTGNPLDLAIDGAGFFRLNNNGVIQYTRDGQYGVDKDGYVVSNQDMRLTGYQADPSGAITNALGDLRVRTDDIEPTPTTQADVGINLDADATEPALAFDYQDASTYNYSTSFDVFDSLGASHRLEMFFRKSATANEWTMNISADGADPALVTGGTNTFSFDAAGRLDTTAFPQPVSIDVPLTNGATTPLTLDVDFSTLTQFAGGFSTNALSQNGYPSGSLIGVVVDNDGVLFGRYTNGQGRSIGQVALVNFQNDQGLNPVGDNGWVETSASGLPVVGNPRTGRLGTIRPATLESSNVELTEELVNMISTQRNFQANAQVISTADELTQTLINLR